MKALPSILLFSLLLAAAVFLAAGLRPAAPVAGFDLQSFGRLPVMHDGRVKPMESMARADLLAISSRQSVSTTGGGISAVQWMLDVMAQQEPGQGYEVFRIDQPDVRDLLGLPQQARVRFAFGEFSTRMQGLEDQVRQASDTPERDRDAFQNALLDLAQKVETYMGLRLAFGYLPVAPARPDADWQTLEQAQKQGQTPGQLSAEQAFFPEMVASYAAHNPDAFNRAVAGYHQYLHEHLPQVQRRASLESLYVRSAIFYRCIILYLGALVLACASWLAWPRLARWSLALVLLTLVAHTAALATRVYIHGRPPVTDLYSSAVFIGWFGVVLAVILELLFGAGLGAAAAGLIGALTLIIAHNLVTGDTMRVMSAVLDSNFWLSTHVICITIGYASTFLAGLLGTLYIFLALFGRSLDQAPQRHLPRMVYGIVCFALIFSFVGTVSGGIWADQSWGRFWGWDPKENGALLIVIWNALILHARLARMVRDRGLAVLTVGGNIVTSWSWFGTNMLGIGLHSYGFMASAMVWLIAFMVSQMLIISLGLLPLPCWRTTSETA